MPVKQSAAELHRAITGLQRLTDLFLERREQLAREAGLTVSQWRVLEEISTEQFMPSLFARRRAQSPAAVSKTLRQLGEKGLLSVSISEGDARKRDYRLSPRGRRALERLRRSRSRAIEVIWGDLGRREMGRFAAFSEELAGRLEAYLSETRR